MNKIIMSREWCMPNSKTFRMKPLRDKIIEYVSKLSKEAIVLDPFANEASIKEYIHCSYISNDLDTDYKTNYNLEAQDFLALFKDNQIDLILYDPVYSPRQVSECYKRLGKTVTMKDTSSGYYVKFKEEISRIVKQGGLVISAGWNSNGIGKKYGFELIEVLMLAHGGAHNDTIITIERKL